MRKVGSWMQPPALPERLLCVKYFTGNPREETMTHDDFAARIIAMQGTLYRVTCTILRNHADREDAVQSAIEKAWRKQDSL